MPVDTSAAGRSSEPLRHRLDRRWVMAFAAGVGEADSCYFDTLRPGGIVAHPVFPVCVDWQAMVRGIPGLADLPADEARRGVHVSHDLELHRPVPIDASVTAWATLEGIEQREAGAYIVVRHEATGEAGQALWTSRMGVLLLDVAVEGNDRPARVDPGASDDGPGDVVQQVARVGISPAAAHVYSACSRIWNPIHTDPEAARDAGLAGPVLHGTATLAVAVSRVIAMELEGDPSPVRRMAARFTRPVPCGSTLNVRVLARRLGAIRFDVVDADGDQVLRGGVIEAA